MILALDTLEYARRLRDCGFSEEQAEGQARALAAAMIDALATKSDFRGLEIRIDTLEQRLIEFESRFERRLGEFERHFETRLVELEKRFETRLVELEKRFEIRLGELEQRFEIRLGELEQRFEIRLGTRLADLERRMTMRLSGMMAVGIGTVAALVKML